MVTNLGDLPPLERHVAGSIEQSSNRPKGDLMVKRSNSEYVSSSFNFLWECLRW